MKFKLFPALVLLAGCQLPPPVQLAPGPEADVAYLASPALLGRAAGSAGGDSAASFIGGRYLELRLRGPFTANCQTTPDCPAALLQFFDIDGLRGKNIAAVITGTDSSLRSQYVVIGAHYDHLGRSPRSAMDPNLDSSHDSAPTTTHPARPASWN